MPFEETNYWKRLAARRLSRRTTLRYAAGASAAGGLALAGCGDDDDSGKSPTAAATQASGGSSPAAGGASPAASPAAAKPKKGGTWRLAMNGDPTNLDPMVGTALPTHQTAGFVYSKLFRFKAGPGIDPGAYSMEPDLAESMTVSPDGLKYTVKLKSNAKWHPPVSRAVDADDVVFSWKRYVGQIQGFPAAPGAASMNLYLGNVEATDPKTVVFTMKEPRGEFLASENKWLWIMPKETGTAFNPAQKLVGTGPFLFESYVPGAGGSIKFKRNPEWHLGPEAPYFDAVEVAIVPEYTTRLQQFLAGRLDTVDLLGQDIQRALDTVKGMQLYVGGAELPNSQISPSDWSGGTVPWKDARVRKAISMALDRNSMLDAAYNLKDLEKLNIGAKRVWNNDVAAADASFWLDPQAKFQAKPSDEKMTADNVKAFAYNPAEAKKLLEAAGATNFKAKLYTTSSRYGNAFNTLTELTQQYLSQIGLQIEIADVDYSSVYITQIVVNKQFEGLLHIPRRTGVRGQFETYRPGGVSNYSKIADQTLNDMITKMYQEADPEKARQQVLKLQNYTNDKMYSIPMQLGAAGGFIGYQPGLNNVKDYQVNGQDWGQECVPYYWRA